MEINFIFYRIILKLMPQQRKQVDVNWMHDVIVSGGGYNGISHGQRVSFSDDTSCRYFLSWSLQKS